jgi:glutamine amidotransferase
VRPACESSPRSRGGTERESKLPARPTETTLVDSPFANIANIARALIAAGADLSVTRNPADIERAGRIVLPGVGSFGAAMQWLRTTRIADAITNATKRDAYLLGICVGHQLLFESSDEMGTTAGLALVTGSVRRLGGALPVPQIGWNRITGRGPLFDSIDRDTPFYFVHSYAAMNAPDEIASADYDCRFTAAVQRARVFGVQFHPEKSSRAGIRILRNFLSCR